MGCCPQCHRHALPGTPCGWPPAKAGRQVRPARGTPSPLQVPGEALATAATLGIFNFLEEISSHSHSVVFLYFFALIAEEGFLISPCYSLELCTQMGISFLFSFAFHFSSFHTTLTGQGPWSIQRDPAQGTKSRGAQGDSCGATEVRSPWTWRGGAPHCSRVTTTLAASPPSPLLFASLLFTAICKASPDSHFAFLHFFSMGIVLIPVSCTMS